jgi:sugar lactone lactonase YvrE
MNARRTTSDFRSIAWLVVLSQLAACGGGGGSSGGNANPPAPATPLALFAGNLDGLGTVDGSGAAARFTSPQSVAMDSAGNIYVADTSNNTIRKITPPGVVSTFAGSAGNSGSTDGTGTDARFYNPSGVATDSADNVYVADTYNDTIRKITPAGVVSTLAGSAGNFGNADGLGAAARFATPTTLAVDGAGNVYVTDTFNNTIRKITPGGVVGTLSVAASFNSPMGVAIDRAGSIYVVDDGSRIVKIASGGAVSTLAGSGGTFGSADGVGTAASFNYPTGLAADVAGNVYVADARNNTIRKITPAGVVSTVAGSAGVTGSADGVGAAAAFEGPSGLAIDGAGNIYVADTYNSTIRRINPQGAVSTLAGAAEVAGSANGVGAAAGFLQPEGIATDSAGNVYVADTWNDMIRKITPAGVVSTIAGSARVDGSKDGSGAAARFFNPIGIAIDSAGNLLVADAANSTIRKIDPSGAVSTLAGLAGVTGSADGSGVAARFKSPEGLAIDGAGNVYVADTSNGTIRVISAAGVVNTLAGSAGVVGSADGTGAAATFKFPSGIATDSTGNIYVADTYNCTIRKITPAGVVSTLAGAAGISGSIDGIGAAARFDLPFGMATDSAGNIYVVDMGDSTIRRITPEGAVSTIAGVSGQVGFNPGPLPGVLARQPWGVAISGNSLYAVMVNGVAVIQLQ